MEPNPGYQYTEPGAYTVSLIISNGSVADTLTMENHIVAYAQPPWVWGFLSTWGGDQGLAWGDYDGDDDLDLFISTTHGVNFLQRNEGGSGFNPVMPSILEISGETTRGGAWGNFDGDGDLDLFMGSSGANKLLRHETGDDFSEVSIPPSCCSTHGVSWVDFDCDGDLDVFAANEGVNALLRNDMGTMTDATPPPLSDAVFSWQGSWGDYDNDGDQDLYVANHTSPSRLFRNEGGGSFIDVTSGPLSANACRSAVWGDYDNDGDLDLYLGRESNQPDMLLRNEGSGVFVDAATDEMSVEKSTESAAWGDYDNDGDLDLFVSRGSTSSQLLRNDGDGAFANRASGPFAEPTTSGAWGDFDNDGDLDVCCVLYETGAIIRNDLPAVNHWLQVELPASRSLSRKRTDSRNLH
jgi:PKD repeat protein